MENQENVKLHIYSVGMLLARQLSLSNYESIILYEHHQILNIVYRYTFSNTTSQTMIWSSIFNGDLYFHITKKLVSPRACDGYVKRIAVRFAAPYQVMPNIRRFTYARARYMYSFFIINLLADR